LGFKIRTDTRGGLLSKRAKIKMAKVISGDI